MKAESWKGRGSGYWMLGAGGKRFRIQDTGCRSLRTRVKAWS